MEILRATALLIGLASLVSVVWGARGTGFPLRSLVRGWMGSNPGAGTVWVGVAAGLVSVLLVPVAGLWSGALRFQVQLAPSFGWFVLAVGSVGMKAALVFFEELIYRGSVCTVLLRWAPPWTVAVLSAVVFSLAHAGRSHLDLLILVLDGVGFAAAFLVLRSLWLPIVWHLVKNVAVWVVHGTGSLELTPGVFRIEYLDASWLVGSSDNPGVGDVLASGLALAFVLWYARRNVPKGAHLSSASLPLNEFEKGSEGTGR